jgi:predicted CopG family antitoxin
MIEMTKKSKYVTIGITNEVYTKLFLLKNDLEREKQKRVSFSDVIDIMIEKSKSLDVTEDDIKGNLQ